MLIWFFLEIPGPVIYLTIESSTMTILFSVGIDLGFGWSVVVISSDLCVELIFYYLFLFHNDILYVYVKTWMTSHEGSRTDLNNLLLVSKIESIVFCLFSSSECKIEFSFSRNTSLVSRTLIVWLFSGSLFSFLSLSNRNDISFFSSYISFMKNDLSHSRRMTWFLTYC